MDDLWSEKRARHRERVQPLAVRMRPRTLDELAGQTHIVSPPGAPPSLLRRMIAAERLASIILHGPPGTGKTTLAEIIANDSRRPFERENAASVGVKRIREITLQSQRRIEEGGQPTILFLDEIHRFSKAQQDVLLDDVERGRLTLIGATTENPMFTVNAALVSRSTIFKLEPLSTKDTRELLQRAIHDSERGYGNLNIHIDEQALDHWANIADGDARRALNALEIAVLSAPDHTSDAASGARRGRGAGAAGGTGAGGRGSGGSAAPQHPIHIDLAAAQDSAQRRAVLYDPKGDQHYDHASAFIKSLRGSDPDAALYYLAVMLEAGEDPRFIARRLAILASEDVGNADPTAITLANSAWTLVERIGMPEARITLAQCTTYLALAPKSNASYAALNAAKAALQQQRKLAPPTYIEDKRKLPSAADPTDNTAYDYAHNNPPNTAIGPVTEQPLLLDEHGKQPAFYQPTTVGFEATLKHRLQEARAVRQNHQATKRTP